MSLYSNVTEQKMITLRKLAEQQKNQHAPELTSRVLKQTHGTKLAESLPPITKKLEESYNYTQKVGDIIKETNSENETPQLAIEITQYGSHPGVVLYDAALENTFPNTEKKQKGFFKIEERDNGDLFWNDIPIEILDDSTLEINED